MATFGITPITGFPPAQAEEFPQFIQFQEDGENLGGPDADTVNFGNGIVATRGTGENSGVVTVTTDGGGTVTAVGLDMPAEFSVDPYEITEAGVFVVTKAAQLANRVWAGPPAGGAAIPAFRPLVVADLPTAPQPANEAWMGPVSGADAAPSFRTLVRADIAAAQRLVWRTVSGNYTLVIGDAENGIAMNGSVLTIPSHSEVPFEDGTSILLLDEGYGNPISVIGQSGVQVKVRSALQPVTAGESALVTIIQRGIDTWYLAGDLEIS